ncbi:MAG TPA: hypothetical protein VHF88_01485 [Thermoleophilaceae bacterium]|nr:hypothetical protein [Thermoleophilaceae bacterium]
MVEAAVADCELAPGEQTPSGAPSEPVSFDVDPESERQLRERPENRPTASSGTAAAQEPYTLKYGPTDITDTSALTGRQYNDFKQTPELAEKFVDPPTPDLEPGPDCGPQRRLAQGSEDLTSWPVDLSRHRRVTPLRLKKIDQVNPLLNNSE